MLVVLKGTGPCMFDKKNAEHALQGNFDGRPTGDRVCTVTQGTQNVADGQGRPGPCRYQAHVVSHTHAVTLSKNAKSP
jgi:hypothetical protein